MEYWKEYYDKFHLKVIVTKNSHNAITCDIFFVFLLELTAMDLGSVLTIYWSEELLH